MSSCRIQNWRRHPQYCGDVEAVERVREHGPQRSGLSGSLLRH